MKRSFLLILVLLLPACRAATPAPQTVPAAASSAVSTAPAALPGALHWFRSSAEYRAATIQTYRLAAERLEEVADDLQPGTWAVSLDADETILDNSQYQKELAETGGHFESATWNAWVRREAAPAIPGAAGFLAIVRKLGGKIAIVTNRGEEVCDATRSNLRKVGLIYDVVLCGSGEKEPRWEMVTKGTASPDLPSLQLVLWLGDNIQDFPDLDQTVRTKPDEAFVDFGVRYFVIPNPVYGSWERNPQE
ncbi:MAG: HAD family acid phosphatase [Thermoanaerobaculia bacterium]